MKTTTTKNLILLDSVSLSLLIRMNEIKNTIIKYISMFEKRKEKTSSKSF
jgi:hypothetical protein